MMYTFLFILLHQIVHAWAVRASRHTRYIYIHICTCMYLIFCCNCNNCSMEVKVVQALPLIYFPSKPVTGESFSLSVERLPSSIIAISRVLLSLYPELFQILVSSMQPPDSLVCVLVSRVTPLDCLHLEEWILTL